MNSMYSDFVHVLIFLGVMAIVVWAPLWIGALLRPKFPFREKSAIYECGEPTIGSSWVRYNMRFYTAALIFLLFDVEVVFLIPVILWLRPMARAAGAGGSMAIPWLILAEIGFFVTVLLIGLIYAWRMGGLDWVRGLETDAMFDRTGLPPRPVGLRLDESPGLVEPAPARADENF